MQWVGAEKKTRLVVLNELLDYIRFPLMTPYYLLDVVTHVAHCYSNTIIRKKVLSLLEEAKCVQLGGKLRYEELHGEIPNSRAVPRKNLQTRLQFDITCTLKGLEHVRLGESVYSKPCVYAGYEFRLGLVHDKDDEEENHRCMTVYLFCWHTKFLPPSFYLPLWYSMEVEKEGTFAPFGSSRRVFKSEWGYGFSVLKGSTWSSILKKKQVINKGAITLRCQIKLMDSTEQDLPA